MVLTWGHGVPNTYWFGKVSHVQRQRSDAPAAYLARQQRRPSLLGAGWSLPLLGPNSVSDWASLTVLLISGAPVLDAYSDHAGICS